MFGQGLDDLQHFTNVKLKTLQKTRVYLLTVA